MIVATTLPSETEPGSRVATAGRSPGRTFIRDVVQRTGLTFRAVRLYEERGLIVSTRDPLGRRWYDADMSERLAFISLARRAGLSLAEIGDLLKTGDRHGHPRRVSDSLVLLRRRLAELDRQRDAVKACLSELDGGAPDP
ncbi:MAG TPA: MerR family transcriptional regulator [Caulobacter sp.]|nr:MerR family transcriptional regulator [Caulobacter sp.]